jgi:dienelactone hydrolase
MRLTKERYHATSPELPGAGHGFFAGDEASTVKYMKQARKAMVAWFAAHL